MQTTWTNFLLFCPPTWRQWKPPITKGKDCWWFLTCFVVVWGARVDQWTNRATLPLDVQWLLTVWMAANSSQAFWSSITAHTHGTVIWFPRLGLAVKLVAGRIMTFGWCEKKMRVKKLHELYCHQTIARKTLSRFEIVTYSRSGWILYLTKVK